MQILFIQVKAVTKVQVQLLITVAFTKLMTSAVLLYALRALLSPKARLRVLFTVQ